MTKLEARRPETGQGESDGPTMGGRKDVLRVLVCGAAASGKTTLVDRLLEEAGQSTALEGGPAGLARFAFETPSRRFVLADACGHKRHTRGLLTGAAEAAHAVLIVDAGAGRHHPNPSPLLHREAVRHLRAGDRRQQDGCGRLRAGPASPRSRMS